MCLLLFAIPSVILVVSALLLGWAGITGTNVIDLINTVWLKRTIYAIIGIIGLILAIGLIGSLIQDFRIHRLVTHHTPRDVLGADRLNNNFVW